MRLVGFDGLEYLFFFLLFLVDLVKIEFEFDWKNVLERTMIDRTLRVTNPIMIFVWVMMLKIPSDGLGIMKM